MAAAVGSLMSVSTCKPAAPAHSLVACRARPLEFAGMVTTALLNDSPSAASASFFSLLKKDAEAALGESFNKAVVTIPANSKGLARHATKLCAGAAGLQVLTLINEPTAAAICYGLNAQQDQTVLVYDFGGGTLDVTILRIHHGIFEEISSKGVGKLGGDDLDLALGKIIAERFEQKTGFDILHSPYKQQFMLAV